MTVTYTCDHCGDATKDANAVLLMYKHSVSSTEDLGLPGEEVKFPTEVSHFCCTSCVVSFMVRRIKSLIFTNTATKEGTNQ